MNMTPVSTAFHVASVFLTRPLTLLGAHSPTTLRTLQLLIHSALLTTFPSRTFSLLISSAAPPPHPLQLACLASKIEWSDWTRALGGAAFVLIVEPTQVYVIRIDNGTVAVVWAASPASRNAIAHSTAPPDVTLLSGGNPDSDSASDTDTDVTADSYSRPSSRSSNFSTFSFSSHASDSSQSSQSSQFSCTNFKENTKTCAPRAEFKTPPTSVPVPTRYIYQGGESTVLTGGVMLGSVRSPTATLRTTSTPKPSKFALSPKPVYTPPHRACNSTTRAPPNVAIGNWRRPAGTLHIKA